MSRKAQAWLPREALEAPRVRDLVSSAVEAWSRKWFAVGCLAAAGFEPLRGTEGEMTGWRRYGAAVALAPGGPAMIQLSALALGVEAGRLVLSEVDRDIIGRFTDRIAADLALCLEQGLGLDPPDRAGEVVAEEVLPHGGLCFTVVNGAGDPVLDGAIPAAVLVGFLKSSIAPARRPVNSLARLQRAVGATPVQVEIRLGETVMGLGDLADLAPGDVLILDRPVAAGAGLVLFRSKRTFANAAITDRGDGVALLLSTQHRES